MIVNADKFLDLPGSFWQQLTLIGKIERGDPLDSVTKKWLVDLLTLVFNGKDPREFAGTMPQDPRKDPRGDVFTLYWLMRERDTKRGSAKRVVADIAQLSGLSPSRIKAIAVTNPHHTVISLYTRFAKAMSTDGKLDRAIEMYSDLVETAKVKKAVSDYGKRARRSKRLRS